MSYKIIIFFVLLVASIVGWLIYGFQSLSFKQTTMAEVERAFPKDSYDAFLKSERLWLYSLKPEKQTENAETFHGYAVLGKTEIDTVAHQKELKGAFVRAMAGAQAAKCFNPRHGLRAETDGKTVDLVICFECENFAVYAGDEKGEGAVSRPDLERPFNQILQNARIELAR